MRDKDWSDPSVKRAVIYARVSTKDQDCERQVRDLLEFANRVGYELVCEPFTETGSGAKVDRKVRAEVMRLAKQRKFDFILVTEMSRWGRSLVDLIHTLQTLDSCGVSVVAQSGIDFDLSSPQGKLLAGVLGALAEFERDLLRERTLSGLAAARAKGKKLGRPVRDKKPSDKYKNRVLEFAAQGRSMRWIADELHISKNTVCALIQRHAVLHSREP